MIWLEKTSCGGFYTSGKVIEGSGLEGQSIITDFGTYKAQPLVVQDANGKRWLVMLKEPSTASLLGKTIKIAGDAINKADYPTILQSNPTIPESAIVKAKIVQ